MKGLRELDVNGDEVSKKGNPKHSIKNFAQVDFTFDVEEQGVPLYNETTNKQINVAKAVAITFQATLDTGSKLTVQAFAVSDSGLAGDAGESWNVTAGDFKVSEYIICVLIIMMEKSFD